MVIIVYCSLFKKQKSYLTGTPLKHYPQLITVGKPADTKAASAGARFRVSAARLRAGIIQEGARRRVPRRK
ncbi:hypothetical protein [Bacteroides pyogenes]|uniref:Uncharacterized protein n=1 Tax=Bacteroides pyogenes TaxID=310300 RepID=A0A5D3F9U4_9BACE|nr:hypothetical protein [Bacteroides pyogenes]TYK32106.1 hypothetical protein FNJ60_13480 [Bacteroides pyogenes]TYK44728.1 hypothetical protein FNG97_12760 [Bacteroides pyogenes]